ncbi:MAG TPA: hypothetical protein PLA94_08315 [Myxococcota bacterium]|nr:hypothetical protein [Myxococcota bacterium]
MSRVRGVKALVHNAVDRTVDLVGSGHEATSRAVMRVLNHAGPLAEPARQVDGLRRELTSGVLQTIKGVNHLVEGLTDAGLDVLAPEGTPAPTVLPLRADVIGTAAWVGDAALGMVNGVVGDFLVERQNGLDLGMAVRGLDDWIQEDGSGIPADASPRIVLLVHGLATTEWSWCMDADKYLGNAGANFGTLLKEDLGYTPLYLRYNSGRHISENGRALAQRLERLLGQWPVAVEELLLLGHSMGGLVLRSACHIAQEEGLSWVKKVRRVVCLASPLQGAALEKFGNLAGAVLSAVDHPATAVIGELIQGRSAGIKDLRYGYVQDAEWAGADPDAVAEDRRRDSSLPPHISWCFISATLSTSPDHPVGAALGDLLVRVESASGPRDAPPRRVIHHVGGVSHAAIQVQPEVYATLYDFLTTEDSVSEECS